MSAQVRQGARIKPSFIPFIWKGIILVMLGFILFGLGVAFLFPTFIAGSLVSLLGLGVMGIGLLSIMIGAIRRNAFTYVITDTDIVVQRQLLGRSVRRIPFAAISDVQVSQSLIGRLANYGDLVPVTKSGYGLLPGMERGENVVAEMTDVPNPDKVADLIMSRLSRQL